MNCKYCGTQLKLTLRGNKNFCPSPKECKKLHMKELAKLRMRRLRGKDSSSKNSIKSKSSDCYAENTGDTVNVTQNHKNSHLKTGSYETDFDSFGGQAWYELVQKYCCNFEMRRREGFCTTLDIPINSYRGKCNDCELGKSLKKWQESKKIKQRRK